MEVRVLALTSLSPSIPLLTLRRLRVLDRLLALPKRYKQNQLDHRFSQGKINALTYFCGQKQYKSCVYEFQQNAAVLCHFIRGWFFFQCKMKQFTFLLPYFALQLLFTEGFPQVMCFKSMIAFNFFENLTHVSALI